MVLRDLTVMSHGAACNAGSSAVLLTAGTLLTSAAMLGGIDKGV